MSRHAIERRFKARTVLVSEGEMTDALYIIIEGKVRAFVSNAEGREVVLSTLARLLLESSVTRDGVQMVPEKLTQTDIASRVGCSREMVSRIFKDLVQGGHISVEPDRIVIHRKRPRCGPLKLNPRQLGMTEDWAPACAGATII